MVALFIALGLFQTAPDEAERVRDGWHRSEALAQQMKAPGFWAAVRDPFERALVDGDPFPLRCRDGALEPLRVIGLITGTPVPKAMVVDGAGEGHLLVRGQLFGIPRHRVERVTRNEVVLRPVEALPGCAPTITLRLDASI